MNTLLNVTIGMENFNSGSAKVNVFHIPTVTHPGMRKELPIGQLERAHGMGVNLVGTSSTAPAARNMIAETGQWTTKTWSVPEGFLVKVFGSRNSTAFGALKISANLIIRLRPQAALRRVQAILTGDERATITRATIEGRFDIMQPDDPTLGLLAPIPAHFMRFYEQGMVRRMFEFNEMSSELAPVATVVAVPVQNTAGETVVVPAVRRPRALQL